ncbi:hypothetical protein [uncultured Erythrobacter sp.]|uniref:hypothetical protein n=1 Tax=uncultured Erythrobacter sp. TaxID=263913 RepID=UPI00262E387E|nr:hypothetical protein [uncultured Erythrobacter sp.]
MSEASFASLGPTLLARKGGAKPAMRPQLAPLPEVVEPEQLEDLGWNDMGQEEAEAASKNSDVVPIQPVLKTRAPRKAANEDGLDSILADNLGGDSPLVAREQKRLAEYLLNDTPAEPLVVKKPNSKKKKKKHAASKPAQKVATGKSAKRAAFTLRLDTDRHLKLRLAATMQGKSAQALVTEALDTLLSEIDDLDALATRMKRH